METWLVLLSLVLPLMVWHETISEELIRQEQAVSYIVEEQQRVAEEQKLQEEKQKLLNETMTEWFIARMEELGSIKYILWHFDELEKKFDCVWLFKAYAIKRGLLNSQEASYINSTVMYLLGNKKTLSQAVRWDVTYRSPLWDSPKHIAMVTRDYDPSDWGLWIIDVQPWNWGKVEERFIQMRWDVFVGKRKILIASNPFVEIAKNKWLEFSPMREYMWYYHLSRYYSPVEWQDNYFNGSYEADYSMNCSWDCLVTANGTRLHNWLVEKVIACPQNYAMWTKLQIEDWFEVTCADRWWSIQGKRLDIRAGVGQEWLNNIKQNKVVTGRRHIYKQNLHSKPINETKIRLRIDDHFGNYSYVASTS
jgi:3D (Asp-Asp-Asp) domain-containing protein